VLSSYALDYIMERNITLTINGDIGFLGPSLCAALAPVRELLCRPLQGRLPWRGALLGVHLYAIHVSPKP
jgi:hypothetical protein